MPWPDSYLDARFRGISFDCIAADEDVQRATVQHSYPYQDGAEVEDLGLQAARFSVRATLFGVDTDRLLQQLKEALDAPGAGELVHPVYGLLNVVVESYKPAFDANNTDSVALDIVFIETVKRAAFFDLAIPEAKIDAVAAASDTAFTAAANAYALGLREILAAANNSRLMQLSALVSQTADQLAQLGSAMKNTAQSYLDLPLLFMADMRSVMRMVIPPAGLVSLQSFSAAQSRLSAAIAPPAFASGTAATTKQDAAFIQTSLNVLASTTLAETAQAVLAAELMQPTATPLQIETMGNTVREQLQAQIDVVAALYPPERARPLIEALKDIALQVQQAARLVIEARPPLLVKAASVSGNYRLIAHALYGDHARAPELARLNPALRSPNFIQQGDSLNVFAR